MKHKLHKLSFLLFSLLISTRFCYGQDPHFTQFFSSPLTLNPAYTGLFNGDLRLAANYRNQWPQIASPFVTGTVSADFGILKNVINPNDVFGVGVLALYDQSAGGALKTTYAALSTAYHKSLDVDGMQTLGLGVQVAYVQDRLDFTKLLFEDQLTSQGFDIGRASGENFTNSGVSYLDYNVGLLYNASIGENSNFYIGGSFYHITHPTKSFLGGTSSLSSRYTLHSGGSFEINKTTSIYASGLYMQQAGASEKDIGAAVGFLLNGLPESPTTFYIGSWYRFGDAVNPYVGLEFNNLQIGISYDVNVSTLRPASLGQGGIEISLIYRKQQAGPSTKRVTCPKF
jgi:type IX secretion system PorP/SprF family membrane protein